MTFDLLHIYQQHRVFNGMTAVVNQGEIVTLIGPNGVGKATLSGGEQQMPFIGRALMTRPKFLLLDEPSRGLASHLH